MQLIAESGSTKTEWIGLVGKNNIFHFQSTGLNPYIQSEEYIDKAIGEGIAGYLDPMAVSKIFFYGAGCSNDANKKKIHSILQKHFPGARIEVEHDLLAAARALWGNSAGIAAILGTGSNSCVYDGKVIIDELPSLGYILGDEGSGAYLGKRLMTDFLYQKMPAALAHKLDLSYPLDKDKILSHIYQQPNPNRWLASFSPFIYDNIEDEYCREMVYSSFSAFFEYHILPYRPSVNLPLGAVGSIAFFYRGLLQEVAAANSLHLTKIVHSPLEALAAYHLSMNKQ